MRVKVLGLYRMNFTTDNGTVNGVRVYYAHTDENVEGLATAHVFISADSKIPLDGVVPNCDCEMQFNQKGKLMSMKLIGTGTTAKT